MHACADDVQNETQVLESLYGNNCRVHQNLIPVYDYGIIPDTYFFFHRYRTLWL